MFTYRYVQLVRECTECTKIIKLEVKFLTLIVGEGFPD